MQLQRFFVKANLSDSVIKIADTTLAHQLTVVLRLGKGGKVILADGKTNEAEAEILDISKKEVSFNIFNRFINYNEPKRKVTLYCALIKHDKFTLTAQKAVEAGVTEIIPIITNRTVKQGFSRVRLQKVIKEAAEQCGRGILPQLSEPINLDKEIKNIDSLGAVILDKTGDSLEKLKPALIDSKKLSIFIGPKGGFTPTEILAAKQAGFKVMSLGSLTLRAETAAIVGSYLLVNL